MINFRYHLVSLTAVFLALAAGITIGAGVVDRATVDQIESQLETVDQRRQETNAQNDRLRADLARWDAFAEQAGDQTVDGRLDGTPLFVVATAGLDRGAVERLRDTFLSAGATVDGVLWFTGKWRLERSEDARELASILDIAPTTAPDESRAAALAAVGTGWATADATPLVPTLLDAGFFEFDPAPASRGAAAAPVPIAGTPRPGALFAILSGDGAEVPTGDLAEPLVRRLSGSQVPVLAAQPVRPPAAADVDDPPEAVTEFVLALRDDPAVAGRISTVDNIDDFRGRYAAVLALRELQRGGTGHYGFGPDARIAPELPDAPPVVIDPPGAGEPAP